MKQVHTVVPQILGAIIQTYLSQQTGACNFCTPAIRGNNVIFPTENGLVIKKILCMKCNYICGKHTDPGCSLNISEIKLQLNKVHKLLLQIWYVPSYNVGSVSIANYSEWNLTKFLVLTSWAGLYRDRSH